MDMTGERRIPAPRQKVWDALNDPSVLQLCIPGCESLEKLGDDRLKATAAVKIGPIAARFTGNVVISDLNPPNSYRISGEGQGGVAGFAKGGANVRLSDDGAFTLLQYDVKAQVGGKIAQLGARLIDATSRQMADLFFDRFTAEVSSPPEVAASGPVGAASKALTPDHPAPSEQAMDQKVAAQGAQMSVRKPMKAKAISILDLIPQEPFGLPRIAIVGIILYIPILFLIFSGYVLG